MIAFNFPVVADLTSRNYQNQRENGMTFEEMVDALALAVDQKDLHEALVLIGQWVKENEVKPCQ
jgi:hypothetical protein